jgi:hypothetical protein
VPPPPPVIVALFRMKTVEPGCQPVPVRTAGVAVEAEPLLAVLKKSALSASFGVPALTDRSSLFSTALSV